MTGVDSLAAAWHPFSPTLCLDDSTPEGGLVGGLDAIAGVVPTTLVQLEVGRLPGHSSYISMEILRVQVVAKLPFLVVSVSRTHLRLESTYWWWTARPYFLPHPWTARGFVFHVGARQPAPFMSGRTHRRAASSWSPHPRGLVLPGGGAWSARRLLLVPLTALTGPIPPASCGAENHRPPFSRGPGRLLCSRPAGRQGAASLECRLLLA